MDELDRRVVSDLQAGFPLCERPYAEAARALGIDEEGLLERLRRLLETNILTRFGPLYDVERLGGALSLCAMSVPADDVARVAALVNAHPEVAHNYERAHRLNLWFVVATEKSSRIAELIEVIERQTGYPVLNLPRE